MDLAAIIGAVSGVISIFGLAYLLGIWKGGVDSKLKDITRLLSQYPPSETALMTKTLWDIYVVDALRNRPDLAEHMEAISRMAEEKGLSVQESIAILSTYLVNNKGV